MNSIITFANRTEVTGDNAAMVISNVLHALFTRSFAPYTIIPWFDNEEIIGHGASLEKIPEYHSDDEEGAETDYYLVRLAEALQLPSSGVVARVMPLYAVVKIQDRGRMVSCGGPDDDFESWLPILCSEITFGFNLATEDDCFEFASISSISEDTKKWWYQMMIDPV